MQRYYFHLYNHLEARDEEGKFLPDMAAAIAYAITNARDVMSENVRDGEICLSHRIEVESEEGQRLTTVAFRDALTVLP